MNKKDIYNLLEERNIWHEITEHKAVYNMEDLLDVPIPYPEGHAKNLFVRDAKKKNYYVITVFGDKKVNLKEFKNKFNTRQLSFASTDELMDIMGLTPGAVSPFGILNDKGLKVSLYIDNKLSEGIIGVHPNENTATIWIKTKDIVELIKEHGNDVYLVDL